MPQDDSNEEVGFPRPLLSHSPSVQGTKGGLDSSGFPPHIANECTHDGRLTQGLRCYLPSGFPRRREFLNQISNQGTHSSGLLNRFLPMDTPAGRPSTTGLHQPPETRGWPLGDSTGLTVLFPCMWHFSPPLYRYKPEWLLGNKVNNPSILLQRKSILYSGLLCPALDSLIGLKKKKKYFGANS